MTEKEILNELINRVKTIGLLKNVDLNLKLASINSITEKLDYLKSIKENYYDKFELLKKNLSNTEDIIFHKNHSLLWSYVFQEDLYSSLYIPKSVYENHIKNELKNPTLTYWFLEYEARLNFNRYINTTGFKKELNSNHRTVFLKRELNTLNKLEQNAIELLYRKEIDIFHYHKNNFYKAKEVTLLRVLDGNYYKENSQDYPYSYASNEVQIYFKHILLKPYLEKLLSNSDNNSNKILDNRIIHSKIIFKPEIIDELFIILKDHFNIDQQNNLKKLLQKTDEIIANKLYFINTGNKLADCFKKLFEANYITGCSKTELQKWILENFSFRSSKTKQEQEYKIKTLEDIISNKDAKAPCKRPLINIQNGKIIKI